jgi:hypothetical protein
MSVGVPVAVVDLTNDQADEIEAGTSHSDVVSSSRKRKLETNQEVWVAIHRLEPGGYQCVGDYENDRNSGCLSHCPTTFDSKIIGVFDTRDKANRCALDYAQELGLDCGDEDDDDDDEVMDFVGEGVFEEGAEQSGDVNTFSQRVFVERHLVQ